MIRHALFALTLAACGPTYDFAQPTFNENASKVPEPIPGAPRPQPAERLSFDYATLPLAKKLPSTKGEVTMSISGSTRASDGYVGVLDVGEQRNFSEGPWGISSQGTPPPSYACLAGAERPATWVAIHPNQKKPLSFEVLEFEGVIDNERCATRAAQVSSASAAAVVPGVLYAYRRCALTSAKPGEPCEEELVLIGPPLEWVTSTGATIDRHLRPQLGSFSRIVVPVRPSTASSILVHIRQADLFKWGGPNVLGSKFESAQTIQITCDVVWASSDPAPLGSVSVAAVSNPADRTQSSRLLGN